MLNLTAISSENSELKSSHKFMLNFETFWRFLLFAQSREQPSEHAFHAKPSLAAEQATSQVYLDPCERSELRERASASKQATNQPTNQSTNQPSKQASKQASNQRTKKPRNQASIQASKQATNQATNQPTNQPSKQATNKTKPTNQPTN